MSTAVYPAGADPPATTPEKSQGITSQQPEEWLERFKCEYTGQHGGETLPPGSDPDRVASAIFTMSVSQAIDRLKATIQEQAQDYSFDAALMDRCQHLVEGHEACGMDQANWDYQVCRTAGLIHNWSPYTEVRAVTLPYDDLAETCESFRAWLLGMFWVVVCTTVNTFFSPRQPGISIPGAVVQLLLVPMGRGMALVLPDCGFSLGGTRYALNPGPWTAKEQLFATIIFSGASNIGNFMGLLVMRLPTFFNQRWVNYGFAIALAWANQIYGLGMAGILRRLTVYPIDAVWPSALPNLALNRTLVTYENKRETVHGWKMTRYACFLLSSLAFLLYYWLPNELFAALRMTNWITWVAPRNFHLAVVTGSYGGMGFNPVSSFDPNFSGSAVMGAPFFAQLQQYVLRAVGGIVILIMYYANTAWGAFMPINSNNVFDNTAQAYNVSKVLTQDNGVDVDHYMAYGPPYYATANLFVTGGNFIYYTFSLVYVFIKYWAPLKKAFVGMVTNTIKRRSIYTGFTDGHTRMMRKYPEVPEWWYGIIFAFGFVMSIVSVTAWPTQTPWWSILAVTAIGALLTIPWVIIESIASTGIGLNVIWQVLPGLWFPGKPMPQLILLMLGGAFEQIAGGFTNELKYAHYARLPPRAVFRGHVAASLLNCVIYCAILELMLGYYNTDGSLCTWDNKQHMVCQYAQSVYASTILFGAFGTYNMFRLYPVLPWCFLVGAVAGLGWLLGEKAAPRLRRHLRGRMADTRFAMLDAAVWQPGARVLACIHPAVALSGALQWAGNNNLAYATLGLYLTWIFQYYLKRHYTAWWGKYAYMVFAGLNVGVAVSGLIATLVFGFGAAKGATLSWWGNDVIAAGVDYQLYNNNASLMALPASGRFGLEPAQYPLDW